MKKEPVNAGRRNAMRMLAAGGAAIPVLGLFGIPLARAEAPQLSEDDPLAKNLQYTHDAASANRPDKGGVAGSEQSCKNCQLIQAAEGAWRPCAIFPGKSVNENGWCVSWTPKS